MLKDVKIDASMISFRIFFDPSSDGFGTSIKLISKLSFVNSSILISLNSLFLLRFADFNPLWYSFSRATMIYLHIVLLINLILGAI